MNIYGAGIAGLLAGCVFQNARIFEANGYQSVQHKALLRFRSSAIGDAVGIDFKKVRVHKGIWSGDNFRFPDIGLANMYSQKVIGRIADRSIWNLDPVDRYIAPEDFILQLLQRCEKRIAWDHFLTVEEITSSEIPAISTIPMSVMSKYIESGSPDFKYAPITVVRWRIPNADVYQTIYFPDAYTTLYRVSITGDLMIAEYAGEEDGGYNFFGAFGLPMNFFSQNRIEKVSQRFGKIAPIDEAWRKKFIFELSTSHNIFSLGRFGTWRNILLDDVLKDIYIIKKLIGTNIYDRSKIFCK